VAGAANAAGAGGAPSDTGQAGGAAGGEAKGAAGAASGAGAGGSGGSGSEEPCDEPSAPLSLRGRYTDDWGTTHVITTDAWVSSSGDWSSTFHVEYFSNSQRWLTALNDPANGYNPNLFSRFDWTLFEGRLYFCQSVYAGLSEPDAQRAPRPDATNPTKTGCGGFSWSGLTPLK
jgi:hypothetical protein